MASTNFLTMRFLTITLGLLLSCFVGYTQCGPDSTLISIIITTDNWGYENYWEIVPTDSGCGNGTLISGGNFGVGCQGTESGGGYPSNSIIEVPDFCLATGQLLDLIFVDSWGDGGPVFELYENGSFSHQFVGGGFGNTWPFEVGNSGLPVYDSPCGALQIIPDGDGVLLDNTFCVAQITEPRPEGGNCGLPGVWCEGNVTNSAWAYFIAEANVNYEITTCNEGAGFDTQLALYRADDCQGWSGFELIAANDDMAGGCGVSNGYSSRIYSSCLEAGATYYIQLDGWEGSLGSAIITVTGVDIPNELDAVVNDINCPIEKSEVPQSSILPFLTAGSSDFTCQWTGPAGFESTEQNISNIGPGEYFLILVDACGVTHAASYLITLPELWTTSITETGTTCRATSDGAADLTVNGATPPYTFEWEGPDGFVSTLEDLSDLSSGNYMVTVTDDNGCETVAYMIIQPENSFNFSLGNDTTLCLDEEVLVFGPSGLFYLWQDMSTNQFFNVVASEWGVGTHAVILTATTPEGCTYADDLNFTITDCVSGVNENVLSGISLYPNPSDGLLQINLGESRESIELCIFDSEGRLVACKSSSGQNRLDWNTGLPAGFYQLLVTSESAVASIRFAVR